MHAVTYWTHIKHNIYYIVNIYFAHFEMLARTRRANKKLFYLCTLKINSMLMRNRNATKIVVFARPLPQSTRIKTPIKKGHNNIVEDFSHSWTTRALHAIPPTIGPTNRRKLCISLLATVWLAIAIFFLIAVFGCAQKHKLINKRNWCTGCSRRAELFSTCHTVRAVDALHRDW